MNLFSRRRRGEGTSVQSKQQSQVGDYFGTFLDTLNDRSSAADSSIQGSSSSSQSMTDSTRGSDVVGADRPATSLALLTKAVALMSGSETLPVTDLQTRVGVGFAEFGELISNLHQLGMIDISGDPGAEQIGLTTQGRLFAQMA
jgi:hypothetical protein